MRLFLGITPEKETKSVLQDLSEGLQKAEHFTPCRANWIPANRFHLTFLFLGEVDKALVPELTTICTGIANETKTVSVAISKLGYFPSPKHPKVLWVGLQDKEKVLQQMNKKLNQMCRDVGIDTPDHQFLPHITLARFKALKGVGAFQNATKSYSGKSYGSWQINRIELIESRLSQDGPEYRTIQDFEFNGS